MQPSGTDKGTDETRPKTRWLIAVDASRCIGSGSCVAMARHQFVFDDRRRSEALCDAMEPDTTVLHAALSCPVDAIAIVEIDGDKTTRLAGDDQK